MISFSFEVYQTVIEQMYNQIVHLALSPSLMTKRVNEIAISCFEKQLIKCCNEKNTPFFKKIIQCFHSLIIMIVSGK